MIKVSQYFTGHGMLGIVFFIVGNIASAWFLASTMNAPSYSPPTATTYLLMGLSGLAVLISVPLMLIGRAYDMQVTEVPKDLRRPEGNQ